MKRNEFEAFALLRRRVKEMRANGEMDAQHDAGAATQLQEQIEEESRDFKSSFCEFRDKRVKCRNVEDLSGKQNEGREWVKSHFMLWAEASFRWRRQKRWDQMTATTADTHCQWVWVITGPASLAEQIGPEHGCSLLLLVPLLQPDTSVPLCHGSTPGSLPLSTLDAGYKEAACVTVQRLVPFLSLHSTWAIRKRPVDVDAGAPLQYGQSTSLQADTSGPPPTYTHEAYGWLELTRIDQMIDFYLFETTVVKTPS